MSARKDAWQYPVRIATGAFILNSGMSKRNADEQTAKSLHGFAAGTYPFLAKMDPKIFAKALSTSEMALGAALLAPFVPEGLVGLGLTAFGAGTVGLYLRTPGMRQPHSLRPTEQGIALAKDAWMMAIGASLVVDALVDRD